ncbi:MAG: hypothetical protein FJ042_05840, partial [Candidatus Cloacimonetes bacterium]|nr:hypothetical protein [Candidatus Cloacimonadota bacterium]
FLSAPGEDIVFSIDRVSVVGALSLCAPGEDIVFSIDRVSVVGALSSAPQARTSSLP